MTTNRHRRWLKLTVLAAVVLAIGGGAYAVLGGSTTQPSTTQVLENGVLTSVPTETVVLLVDVSNSMEATDVSPTRLGAAVSAMRTFLEQLPERFDVGLVTFDSTGTDLQRPTSDRRLVLDALDTLEPNAATALGDGLATAVQLTVATLERRGIRRATGHDLPAAIVLVAGGAQNRGTTTPLEAARRAKAAGIRVHAVALGTPAGRIGIGIGAYKRAVSAPSDPRTVTQIARVTGGESFIALTAAHLQEIYSSLAARIAR